MGIASMILGIVALVVSFIPFCGVWAVIPAVVGLILGIVDVVLRGKRNEGKGMGIAGVVLNPLAIIVSITWWLLAGAFVNTAASAATDFNAQWQQQMQQQMQQLPQQGNIPSVPIQPLQPMQPVQPEQPEQPEQPQP